MQIEKQISCYMAADSTAKSEICKPYLLALYLRDERVNICLRQTGSLKQYCKQGRKGTCHRAGK